ncbi:Gti1/Pac2 family-domain-containing protein [Thelephora terrestris]|uniref:Gti1/Pac2 family-domain-containing protein n=1 Tax=Thelephora terrestris TaxID=56493 RepID=A0A9P6LD61_9AGAM|nr:Gti1/Pac2 family-domain-containing protein [Thelephora terrestris]
MQNPTCIGIRIRSARDANILFHAVALNLLPLITRRLDEAERLQVKSGCVYVWEERNPSYFDFNGQEMKRFTEGRSWGPSKARDEFLFYYEKENGIKSQMVERMKSGPRANRAQLVKQTYSVNVHTPNSPNVKKWHLNAYYCHDEIEDLATVDDIPLLKNLQVPHELYTCARTSRAREAAIRSHNNPGLQAVREPPRNMPPFPYPHRSEDIEQRSSSGSDSSGRDRSSSPDASLAPLEFLESLPRLGRHPMDDRALRLFDSAANQDR